MQNYGWKTACHLYVLLMFIPFLLIVFREDSLLEYGRYLCIKFNANYYG